MKRFPRISLALVLALSGCSTRMSAGRGTSLSALDLSIGMMPINVSLNPNQNMYPGVASLMDAQGLFKSVEPVASSPDKQFDLLLLTGTGQFSTELTIRSGYSNKELFKTKVMAFYGIGGKKAIRNIYQAFKVGTPAYQEIMAERAVWRRTHGKPAAGGVSREEIASIVREAVQEGKPAKKGLEPVSDADRPAYSGKPRPDDYALVVGIEDYSNLPAAEYAERDAWAVKRHLLALGLPERNIAYLAGKDASRSGLVKNLETWLPNNVKPGSTVFVYFSGHGAPDTGSGEAYLVPWDGDPQYLKDTGYPTSRLYAKLGELKAERVFVAMDACFSGAGGRSVLAKGTRPLMLKVDMGAVDEKVVSLSAAAGDQVSSTIEDQGHGAFTYYLLRGLNGAAKDDSGKITAGSLYDYLTPNVQDAARRENRDQTPQLRGDGAALRLR